MTDILLAMLVIVVGHFVADYPLQVFSKKMAKKSSNLEALSYHVWVYSVAMFFFACLVMPWGLAFTFAFLNGAFHWATDYFTSRLTGQLWKKTMAGYKDGKFQDQRSISLFFLVLGVDQTLHYATLISTFFLLGAVA